MPDADQLQQRLDWILLRLDEARHRYDEVIRDKSSQTDFNGFLSGIEWIATGRAQESFDDYPEFGYERPRK